MSQISTPLFKADNTEQLEVADAYDVTSERPINKLYQASKEKIEIGYERVGGAKGLVTGVVRLMDDKKAGIKGTDLLERGLGMFGVNGRAVLRSASDGIIDKAGAFVGLDPSMTTKVKRTADDAIRIVSSGNTRDISQYGSVVSLIGDMTGDPALTEQINIGFESAIWGATFAETNSYGAHDYYERVKAHVDPAVYTQAVIYSLPSAATSGSLEAVQQVLRALSPDVILANQPDFIPMFLSQFKLPNPHPTDLEAFGVEVVTALSTLDALWYTYKHESIDPVYDFKYLTKATPDAIQVLSTHPVLGPLIQLAGFFPEKTVAEVIRQEFPRMAVQG